MLINEEQLIVLRTGELEEAENLLVSLQNKFIEQVYLTLPFAIMQLSTHSRTLTEMAEKFYTTNPQYKDHKQLVSATIQAVESEKPGLELQKLLEEAKLIVEAKLKEIA
jgi:hypothetical protein